MAYMTGTETSLSGLMTALVRFAGMNGWTAADTTLTRGDASIFLCIADAQSHDFYGPRPVIRIRANDAPGAAAIGEIGNYKDSHTIAFPATWHGFANGSEVYFFVQYDVERFQWLAFGQSPVPGLPGTGVWHAGTVGSALGKNVGMGYAGMPQPKIQINAAGGGGGNSDVTSAALFWSTSHFQYAGRYPCNAMFHHGMTDVDVGTNWSCPRAIPFAAPHVARTPNAWNQEALLIPIRPGIARPESKTSVVGQIEHARYIRIDHYNPGDILTQGPDRWMVFPWFRKTDAATGSDGTGRFGVALRM